MLSTGAFNALLKTLEEPPEHVKFILATTEPQKLPATILSRCQRFDFKRISNQDIIKRLKIICKDSKIDITDEALKIIAVLSEGAMRDAISILERCTGEQKGLIDDNIVRELVGIPKKVQIYSIVKAIIESNADEVINNSNIIINEGKDIDNFLWELIKYIKDVLVYKSSKKLEIYKKKKKNQIDQLAEKVTKERLLHLIYELSDLENDMKWSSQKTIMLEAGFIRLCDTSVKAKMEIPVNIPTASSVNNQELQELQRRIFKIENFLSQISRSKTESLTNNIKQQPKSEEKKIERKPLSPEELKNNAFWKDIVVKFKTEGKMGLYTNLLNTNITEINDMTVGINFANGLKPLAKGILEKPENISEISKEISIAFGKEMKVKLIDNKVDKKPEKSELENLVQGLDIPIDIIEE